MISAEGVKALIAQYEKFGWRLRRVLLTRELRARIGDTIGTLFGSAEVFDSDLDAAWFSRPSRGNGVAWEIRRLDDQPFALVEVVDVEADEDATDDVFSKLEADLRGRINKASAGSHNGLDTTRSG